MNYLTRSLEIPAGPDSVQEIIKQRSIALSRSATLHAELRSEEMKTRGEVQGLIPWILSICVLVMYILGPQVVLFSVFNVLLPRANTVMERAERARQSQEELIEFQYQAIERLDSIRGSIQEVIVRLQTPFADE